MLPLGSMQMITTQSELDTYLARIRGAEVIFLDTEFLRETTYYPKLCVVQAKIKGDDPVAIDALSPDLELQPFWSAILDERMIKVFHAGRQDLEIIVTACGHVPTPLFDTQIAASVLGYGEQAGFETLVRAILKHQLDKGSQFTDWSRRPLTERQLKYALDDVRYLEPIYERLLHDLDKQSRASWVTEDMAVLSTLETYQIDPQSLWRRVKIKSDKPRDLAVLQAVAAWREIEAQRRDLPRGRVLKDDPMAEIALHHPRTIDELCAIRGLDKGMARGKLGGGLLEAVATGLGLSDDQCPRVNKRKPLHDEQELLLDILKLVVKMRARELGMAARMLASSDDLDVLVREGFEHSPLSSGWRYDVLGRELLENPRFGFEFDLRAQTIRLTHQ